MLSAIFQLHVYHDENNLHFDEMIIMSALYYTNTLSWILIVSLKQQSLGRHVNSLGHITLITSQPVSALTP